ncbi:low-density lipoprotein receptor-related protein 3 [Astyanax mexicanus]|uniref:low-density lipoprotein receptor-related protein 3 n=1 Tax=Astyanax mexicanus TaxID=7994 RepID=UPI0020CB2B3B|nr:low-density lipoprotein receptor-related protein 3 [Astyanax mexicanus]
MMAKVVAVKLYLVLSCLSLRLSWVYPAGCSGKVELHTERRGVIYSPSWPLNYPAGVNCSWNIQGNRGEVITISFHSFDVEESGGCRGDWLLLGPTWKEEYRVCGSVLPPPFISSRGRVWVHFHSQGNSSGLAQGFRLSYIRSRLGESSCESDEYLCGNGKCVPRSWRCNGLDECGDNTDERSCAPSPTPARASLCPPGTLECSHAQSTRCLPSTLRCNGALDCPDGSDEAHCPDISCGKRLANFYGTFASPDFFRPNRSSGTDLYCTWLLDTQDTKPLLLRLDLQLGVGDSLCVYDGLGERAERLLQSLSHHNNHRPAVLESSQGQMSVLYHARPHSQGHGFNASYQVKGYCFPGEFPCGPDEGCYSKQQRCDGYWHCPGGRDEEGCPPCPPGQYPCEGGGGACYQASERCDNQKKCPGGSDEKNCFSCQPGNFHCGTNLCIFETWRCDGQEDCLDGSDERDCPAAVPRKVITAALIGSLVCGLLLVIALGCAFKLYSLRTREYRAFETQMTRLEAEFVQREAPPSYGQLIAQGLIPPVEDFPAYHPNQASILQNLRTAMRRQIRRHSSRRGTSRRRLGRLWSRLFHRGSRLRGQIPLLTPPGHAHTRSHTQPAPGLHSYRAADARRGESENRPGLGHALVPCSDAALGLAMQAHAQALHLPHCETPPSPLSPASPRSTSDTLEDEDEEDSDHRSPELAEDSMMSSVRSSLGSEAPSAGHRDMDKPSGAPDESSNGLYRLRVSRRTVQSLAAELGGVSVKRYSSLAISPMSSPESLTSSSSQNEEEGCSLTDKENETFADSHPEMNSDTRPPSQLDENSKDWSIKETLPCDLTSSDEEDDIPSLFPMDSYHGD